MTEGAYRLYTAVKPDNRLVVEHPELGWVHNTKHIVINRKNLCDENIEITAPDHSLLNKRDKNPEGLRQVLFIGDSFTHAYNVGDHFSYVDLLIKHFDGKYAINAAGLMGTGTTHQVLMLEHILKELTPDLIVWQLTENDVENNVPIFDERDPIAAPRTRPYRNMDDNSLFYPRMGTWLFRHSKAAFWLFHKARTIGLRANVDIVQILTQYTSKPLTQKEKMSGYVKGAEITGWEIGQARIKHQIPIIAFSVNTPRDALYADALKKWNIPFYPIGANPKFKPGVTDCLPLDDHWNIQGNAVAADLLAPVVEQHLSLLDD